MGLGREVADAYISVHGDLSDFRKDLGKANDEGKAFGTDLADSINEGFAKRGFKEVQSKWESVLDALYTGSPFDWDKALGKFDSTDLDVAHEKILEFMNDMDAAGKITGKQYDVVTKQIGDAVKAQHQMMFAGRDAENERSAAAEAQRRDNDQLLFDYARMQEAQQNYNKSFEAMFRANRMNDLNSDFTKMVRAVNDMDWTKFADGFADLDGMRDRVAEVNGEMFRLGRISQDNADRMRNDVAVWIAGEEERRRSITDTTVEVERSAEVDVKSFRRKAAAALGFGTVLAGVFKATRGFREHLAGFAGINVFGDMIKEGLDFIHNLDRIAVSAALTTTRLATMASVGGSGLASLITIAADLGPVIGGLGAVVPGFFIGAAIQAAVLKSALQDMDTVLKDLAPAFHRLQDSISAKFWAQAEAPIRNMVKTLLPTLTTNLNNTATSLGGLFGSFANAIASIRPEVMTRMFDRMNAGIEIAKGAMAPLVSAFTTLGLAASLYFERFGAWITQLSTDFNNFIQQAAGDGRLLGWIDAMIAGFQNIGRAIDGVFGIFNALDAAASAAGFGGLASFADNLQGIAAAMQSAGAQTALTQLFSGMLILVSKIGDALGNLGPAIQSIMPTVNLALSAVGTAVATVIGYIGQVLQNPMVQQGITDFTNGIASAVAKLGPAVEPFANSLGNIMTLFGLILQNVANIVTAFTVQLGPILDQVSAKFQTLVAPLGDAVVHLITALAPVAQAINDNLVDPIVSGIRDYILPGFTSMVDTLGPVAATMIAALGPVLQSILPLIPPIMELATIIGTILGQAVTALAPLFVTLMGAIMPIVDAIMSLVNVIAPVLIPAIDQIVAALTPVITVIGQVVGVIVGVLAPILGVLIVGIINNVVGVIHGFSEVFMAVFNIIQAVITGFGGFFSKIFAGDVPGALNALGEMFGTIWDNIGKLLMGALEFLWNAVQLLFIGKLIGGIKSALSGIGGFFKSFWDDIVAFFKLIMQNTAEAAQIGFNAVRNIISTVFNAVKDFISTVWNGIVSVLRTVWDWILNIVKTGVSNFTANVTNGFNAVKNFISAVWNGIVSIIRTVWGWISSVVTNGINLVRNGISSGMSAVQNFFANGWNNAVNLISGAWRNIVSAVSSGANTVVAWVKGLPGWISSALGNLGNLLLGAGQSIMDGLRKGLEGAWQGVQNFVGSIAQWIADHKGPISYDKKLLVPAGEAIMHGLESSMKDKFGNVMSFVESMAAMMAGGFDKSKMYVAGADAAKGLADGLKAEKSTVFAALGALTPDATLSAKITATGTGGVGGSTPVPAGKVVNIEAGAIAVSTPATDGTIVANQVLDALINNSSF